MNASDKARLNQVGIPVDTGSGKQGDGTRGVGDLVEAAITANNNAFTPSTGTLTVTGAVTASGVITGDDVTAVDTVTGVSVTATGTVTGADVTATDDLTTVDLFVTGDTTLGTSKTVAFTTSLIFKDAVSGNTMASLTDSGTTGTLGITIVRPLTSSPSGVIYATDDDLDYGYGAASGLPVIRVSAASVFSWDNSGNATVAAGRALNTSIGTGTAAPVAGGVLTLISTAVGNVDAGTDDLITYSLPASSLVAAGRGIRIKAWGTTANNANAKTLTLDFGSQVISTQAMTVNEANVWEMTAVVARTGASTQDIFARLDQLTGTALRKGTITAGTQTETGAIVIKCTGTATTTNDIVCEGMLIEAL